MLFLVFPVILFWLIRLCITPLSLFPRWFTAARLPGAQVSGHDVTPLKSSSLCYLKVTALHFSMVKKRKYQLWVHWRTVHHISSFPAEKTLLLCFGTQLGMLVRWRLLRPETYSMNGCEHKQLQRKLDFTLRIGIYCIHNVSRGAFAG